MKVFLLPKFEGPDRGEGGIRRVVEAQERLLPEMGIELVQSIEDADLVASHAGMLPKVPADIPWVVHTHGLYWSEYRWPKWAHDLNAQVTAAMIQADHVTAPSQWVANAIGRGTWIKPTVLYHGIYPDDWTVGVNEGYVLWNKTRVDPICDPEPVNMLAEAAPDLTFVSTFGKERSNVLLTGRLPHEQAKSIIRAAGVYLCTTRETMGIGTLEAMAAGVPVVGWDWAGQHEIIENGVNGLLVPVGNYDELKDALRWALANREQIGARARASVIDRFSWETVMEDYVKLYTELYESHAERYHSPKVSVVMPCYNLAQYLPTAIDSIQQQTTDDWELIIVNDASSDDTQEVALKYAEADKRIKVIQNSENLYLAGALNVGVQAAQGRYIINVDADNQITPDTLTLLSDALEVDRSIGITYGKCRFVLEDGETPDLDVSGDGISSWPKDFKYQDQIRQRNQIPSTAMYRRTAWVRSGGYRTRWKTAEDADFWTRITSIGFKPKMATQAVTLIYRQRDDSMSRQHAVPDYSNWFPWSRNIARTPFGIPMKPPSDINGGIAWNVPSAEPVHVSVIIPVGPKHNKWLTDALDSVYAQTYPFWEVIVVNDSGQPLTWHSGFAKYMKTDRPRSGPAAARNIGIKESVGNLLVFLDADDYLQPDALELMVGTWKTNGGVVYGQWYDEVQPTEVTIYDPPEYDAQLLVSKGAIHAVTALYPKKSVVEVGLFDEDISHWEDWDMQLLLAAVGCCGTKINKPLFTYRKHTGKRREQNIASFNQGKDAIMAKWHDLWEGSATLMGCARCPGGGGLQQQINQSAIVDANITGQARAGYVFVRYNGKQPSTRTYRGQSTGQMYRFGGSDKNRVKLVLENDVEYFLSLTETGFGKQFQVIEPQGAWQSPEPSPAISTSVVNKLPEPSLPPTVAEAMRAGDTIPVKTPAESLAELERQTTAEFDEQTTGEQQPDDPVTLAATMTIGELRKLIPRTQTADLMRILEAEKVGNNRKQAIAILEQTIAKRESVR